jgi:hypothetical protein
MEPEHGKITLRQLMVITLTAVLSPLIRVVPGNSLQTAGKAAWLCPLLALLPLLLTIYIVGKGLEAAEGKGLGGLLQEAYGSVLGKLFCALEGIWLLLQGGVALRLYGERFLGSVYRDASLMLFLVTLVVLALWLCSSSLPAIARLAQMCFYGVTVTIGVILVLSLPNIRLENVLPVWWDDLPQAAVGMVPMLEVGAIWLSGTFLAGQVEAKQGIRKAAAWMGWLCLLSAVLSFVAVGVFGVGLSDRLQVPFFSLAKEIRIGGALERVEALVITVWVLADMILLLLLLRGFGAVMGEMLGEKNGTEFCYPAVFLMLAVAMVSGGELNQVQQVADRWLGPAGLVLLYGIPVLGGLILIVRKKRRKKC